MAFLIGHGGEVLFGSTNDPYTLYVTGWTLRQERDVISRRTWNSATPVRSDPGAGTDTDGVVGGNESWSGTWEALANDEELLRVSVFSGTSNAITLRDSYQEWSGTALVTLADYTVEDEALNRLRGTFVGTSELDGPQPSPGN